MSSDPWYQDGLRFQCTQCGNCCTGPPGAVWFDEAEGQAMAESLGMKPAQFLKQHARRLRDGWSLNEHLTEHGYDCVFLDRKSVPGKAICGLYHARPKQCRTWPFWPENLSNPDAWKNAKQTTPCPGMDQGPLISLDIIQSQHDEMIED